MNAPAPCAWPSMVGRKFIGYTTPKVVQLTDIYRVKRSSGLSAKDVYATDRVEHCADLIEIKRDPRTACAEPTDNRLLIDYSCCASPFWVCASGPHPQGLRNPKGMRATRITLIRTLNPNIKARFSRIRLIANTPLSPFEEALCLPFEIRLDEVVGR